MSQIDIIWIIVAAAVILLTIRGYSRGIFGLVIGVASWIFMFFFVPYATPRIYENLQQNESLSTTISGNVSGFLEERAKDITIDNVADQEKKDMISAIEAYLPEGTMEQYEDLADNIREYTKALGLIDDDAIKEQVKQQAEEAFENQKRQVIDEATPIVSDYILQAMAMVLAILMGVIICALANVIAKLLNKAPVIGRTSHFIGALFGFVEGVAVVWAVYYAFHSNLLGSLLHPPA